MWYFYFQIVKFISWLSNQLSTFTVLEQKFCAFLLVVDHHLKSITANVHKSVKKSDKWRWQQWNTSAITSAQVDHYICHMRMWMRLSQHHFFVALTTSWITPWMVIHNNSINGADSNLNNFLAKKHRCYIPNQLIEPLNK